MHVNDDYLEKSDPYLSAGASYFRLLEEYFKYGKLYIGFDFDDTVHDYHKLGRSYPDMIDLLRDLKSIDCILICWTANPDELYVAKYLAEKGIPFDNINAGSIPLEKETRKPMFSAILDDRCGLIQVYQDLVMLVRTIKIIRKHDRKIQESL